MTGYGSASLSSDNYKVSVELKSLNSKYIEINMKLPRTYMEREMTLRNLLTQRLQRGKINAVLDVEVLSPDRHRLRINEDLVRAYSERLEKLRGDLGLAASVDLEYLLSLPDAIQNDHESADAEEWGLVERAFREAAERLVESRSKEGTALESDLSKCRGLIADHLEEVKALLPRRSAHIRERVQNAIQEIKDRAQIDGNRYEQELIYYIEKLDINEEVVRLEKHLEYFDTSLKEARSNGKKLGFISQEMGREINTIGSKANDAGIQQNVVRMKEELEKIKEQVLNIV